MKKYIAILVGLLLIPFLVRPSNFIELYAPFHDGQYLLATAIMQEPDDRDSFELAWPNWLIRLVVANYDFKFAKNFDDNQSKLQFILAALFEHEEGKSTEDEIGYVLSLAQRAIDEGSDINNVASYGLSGLHEAVLFNSIVAADFLISNGAECNKVVSRPGKPIDGMGALEMAEYLSTKSDKNRADILAYLKSQECNKSSKKDALTRASS